MADNTVQSGADTIATDDVTTLNGGASTGVKVQRTKVTFGDDGTARDVSAAFPLPVTSEDVSSAGTITATDAVLGNHGGLGVPLTGTPTAGSYVTLPLNGQGGFTLRLSGAFGGGTVWMESSVDSTNGVDGAWTTNLVRQSGIDVTFLDASITTAGIFRGTAAGYSYLRVRVAGATTPSIGVAFRAAAVPSVTALVASLPPGANTIGGVNGGALATTSGAVAAAGTGTIGPLSVGTAGNVTFTVKNTVPASAWAGAPVMVFEQSDDNVSWGQLTVVRGDNQQTASTHVLPAGTASGSIMFDAPAESISYVRARVTTGPTTNGLTVVISSGGMPFTPYTTVIDRKDAARTNVAVTFTSAAAAVADTLLTVALNKGATASSVTTVPVSAGKVLRITGITVGLRTTTTVVPFGKVTLRVNYAGAAVLASPAAAYVPVAGFAAVAGNAGFATYTNADGIVDLQGTSQFGVSFSNNVATNVTDITVTGYEFASQA